MQNIDFTDEDYDFDEDDYEEREYQRAMDACCACSCGAYYMKKDQTLGIRSDCICGATF